MNGSTTPASPDIERFNFLQEAVAAVAALASADRLGVLTRLERGPVDPATLARDCAIGRRGACLLLSALAGMGMLEAVGDGFYRAAGTDLTRLAALAGMWDGLDAAVRDDRPAVAGDTPAGAESFYPDVVTYLGAMLAPAAEIAADRLKAICESAGPHPLPPLLRVGEGMRGEGVDERVDGDGDRGLAGVSERGRGGLGLGILDIGAGAAPWSIALARRDPECRIRAVDLPAVLPATRRAVSASGCEAQFDYLGGDLFTVEWGRAAYDLAIAGNICHLFDEGANRRLLRRVRDALRPGGRLAIVDILPNEQLDGPRPAVLYALGLLLRTRGGRAYPFSTYVSWLREAGYEAVERFDLPGVVPSSLITARRA